MSARLSSSSSTHAAHLQFRQKGRFGFECVVVLPARLADIRERFIGDGVLRPAATRVSQTITIFEQPRVEKQLASSRLRSQAHSSAVTISSDAHEHDTGTEPSFLSQLFSTFSLVTSAAILLMAAAVGATVFLPDIYYAVADADIIEHQPREADSVVGGVYAAGPEATRQQLDPANIDERQKRYLPPKNEYLPEGEWVVIPRIGVYTQRRVTQDPDEALQEGVWQVPDFGEAGDLSKPMILAAHRFGFTWWWNSDYWEYHSFYNLPELEAGDRVEIISDQRRYVYEIYKAEEGDEITDYSADLILYTCKFLNSPVRHVRYARLLPV